MLVEFKKVRQSSGEEHRRWFGDDTSEMELFVWEKPDGSYLGFQFCYLDKGSEQAFTWHQQRGFSCKQVTNGWPGITRAGGFSHTGGFTHTPLLVAEARFRKNRLATLFAERSENMEGPLRDWILGQINRYDGR